MGPLDAIWHLLNFVAPAIGVGMLAAALCKLLWWRALRGQPWTALAARAVLANVGVSVFGLLWWQRDGRISTYAVMVLVTAAVLWWRAFYVVKPASINDGSQA